MTPLRKRFKELWPSWLSYAEIARLLGVSERLLYKIRAELDLPHRPRGRRKL